MPLLALWKSNPQAVNELSIEQAVATAGDGKLRDDSECSRELREYLSQVSTDTLALYSEHCLNNAFPKSGLVLQDIVNEVGRRLDYHVTNGRYQGTSRTVGFDGIWASPEGPAIVVEVKTSDAYRISLDTIAGYRNKLQQTAAVVSTASILVVVGREDTGELEAQIRGSRHAWDMRLISVDALLALVRIKESTDSAVTSTKIRSVLVPLEYTRLDSLVDVMFTTAKDVEAAVDSEKLPDAAESDEELGAWEFTARTVLQAKRDAVIQALGERDGKKLIRRSRALYWDADHAVRVVCTVSKRYTKKGTTPYWYAYHPSWDTFLGEAAVGWLALGCVDLDVAFALPLPLVRENLPHLNVTGPADRPDYWHLKILERAPAVFALQLPKIASNLPLSSFAVPIR